MSRQQQVSVVRHRCLSLLLRHRLQQNYKHIITGSLETSGLEQIFQYLFAMMAFIIGA